jgi:hypothetical protein
MASLAEIRAKLKSQEVNRSTSNTGGDNAIYPHWNISEGSEAVVRFLPDKDETNTFFWTERNMIKLPFAGIKGQTDSRPVTVQVPCMEMYGKTCPVLTEVRPWFKDKSMEDMGRKYWKKKSYIFQGFVTTNPLAEDSTPKWTRRERALDEAERAAIDSHGLHNLGDFRPKEPTEAEVKIIKELFEKSVEGEAYDLEQYGQYFRPAGVAYQGKPKVAVPTASAPAATAVTEAATTAAPVTESAPAPQPAVAMAPAGDSAKRAEDILKLIRSRQAK